MNIPDKALQAAARSLVAAPFDEVPRELSDIIVRLLEAAAPFIAAQALRDAADWIECKEPHGDRHPEYLAANREDVYLLRSRAYDLEAGK